VIDHWIAIARDPSLPLTTLMQQLMAAACHNTLDRLREIGHETLIIGSELDRLIPPECSRILARHIPQSELAWLSAGHDFATEQPQETAELLTSFLAPRCDESGA
jgi:pimeloyl-ACP methyl ester carboxylesterase